MGIVDFMNVRKASAKEVIAYLTAHTTLSPTAENLTKFGWDEWIKAGVRCYRLGWILEMGHGFFREP